MKLFYSVFILMLSCKLVYSQIIFGKVIDSISQNPIELVNISFPEKNQGISTKIDGTYQINISKSQKKLIFSSVGYESKTIDNSQFVENANYELIVLLKPKIESLKEVLISNNKINYAINKTIKSEKGSIANSSFQFGTEICNFIENKYGKRGKLKKVILSLHKMQKYDYVATYNIKFYRYDSITKKPGAELFSKNTIVKPENKTYKLKIDVENKGITIPKAGICIGVEIVNIEYENAKMTMALIAPFLNFSETEKEMKRLSWARYRNKVWETRSKNVLYLKNKESNLIIDIECKFAK